MLVAGTVNISFDTAGNPVYAGTGLALALAQARFAPVYAAAVAAAAATPSQLLPPSPPDFPNPTLCGPQAAVISLQTTGAATYAANAIIDATAIVGYFVANAEIVLSAVAAHVTSQSLGAVPSSTAAGTPIAAPASPVDVPLVGTGAIA